jgi:hypothetical protein
MRASSARGPHPRRGDAPGERSEDRGCMQPPVDIEDDRRGRLRHRAATRPSHARALQFPAMAVRTCVPRPRCAGGSASLRSSTRLLHKLSSVGVVLTDVHRVTPVAQAGMERPTRCASAGELGPVRCSGTSAGPMPSCPSGRRCGSPSARSTSRRFLRACTDSGAGIERVRRVRRPCSALLAEPELPAAAVRAVHPTVHAQLAEDALEVGLDGVAETKSSLAISSVEYIWASRSRT